jgi:o-succinylbenzoate synthase
LPLCRPWRSAPGAFSQRRGWLVRVESAGGIVGWGDCAPLPEIGTESFDAAREALNYFLSRVNGLAPEAALQLLDESAANAPAACCGMEAALLDVLSRTVGVPLARWLNPVAPMSVKANAALGALDAESAERGRQLAREGFQVLKVKLGCQPPEAELAGLRELVRGLPPEAVLRLDANGAWTMPQAQAFIAGLAGLPVESLEEPLANPNLADLWQLQEQARFPLAVDESLTRIGEQALIESVAVRRLVLKPMVLGGVRAAYALARRAEQAGMECVATTTVDSAVGVWAALHLAAALDNGLAHGVATSSWLMQDVGNSPQVTEGRGFLDNGTNGLGFSACIE